MLRLFSSSEAAGAPDNGFAEVAIVLPSHAQVDYIPLLKKILDGSTFSRFAPSWRPGCFGGGVLTFADCSEGIRTLIRPIQMASSPMAFNQVRGIEIGNGAGMVLRRRISKMSTELGNLCAHTGTHVVRHPDVRVTIENDNSYSERLYTMIVTSQRKSMNTETEPALVKGFESLGYNFANRTESPPEGAKSWQDFTQGRSSLCLSWIANEPIKCLQLLADAWYVAEHVDLAVEPLQDFAIIGRLASKANFRPHWTIWQT